jgi:hypothetical protein
MHSSSMVYGIIKSILCVGTAGSYVLGGPRRRRRRRINLSYHQRIRRLSSGIERLSKRRCGPCSSDEKPGEENMTSCVTDNEDKVTSAFDSEAVSSFLATFNPLDHYHQLSKLHLGTTPVPNVTQKFVLYAAAPPPFACLPIFQPTLICSNLALSEKFPS